MDKDQATTVAKQNLEIMEAYQATFSTPSGQLVLEHLAKHCHFFDCSHERGDPNAIYINEGARRVFLSILRFLDMDLVKVRETLRRVDP